MSWTASAQDLDKALQENQVGEWARIITDNHSGSESKSTVAILAKADSVVPPTDRSEVLVAIGWVGGPSARSYLWKVFEEVKGTRLDEVVLNVLNFPYCRQLSDLPRLFGVVESEACTDLCRVTAVEGVLARMHVSHKAAEDTAHLLTSIESLPRRLAPHPHRNLLRCLDEIAGWPELSNDVHRKALTLKDAFSSRKAQRK